MSLWSRFRNRNKDLTDEIQAHLNLAVRDHLDRGESAAEARAHARRDLGNELLIKESTRRKWPWSAIQSLSIDGLWQDLKFAGRQLRLNPGFAVVAVLTLALGIGANAAIFQLLNAVRLQALPVRNPQELVEISIPGGNHGFGTNHGWNSVTFPLWEQIRDHQQAFTGVFAWSGPDNMYVGEGAERRQTRVVWASGEAFSTLGVTPERGRLLTTDDDRNGCRSGAVVISYGFWQNQFAGQNSAVGARLIAEGKPFTIVGVTPPEFYGLEAGKNFDIALPACTYSLWDPDGLSANVFWLGVMGRLKPEWTVERAVSSIEAASGAWFEAVTPNGYGAAALDTWKRFRLTAEANPSGTGSLRKRYETSIFLLMGITAFVLLIACVNLANLLLARATTRTKEIAVRMALGGSRLRIVSQLFVESLLLSAAGAIAGVAIAPFLSRALVHFLDTSRDRIELNLELDWRVLAFTSAVALFTGICFGLSTAIYSTRGRSTSSDQLRVRGGTGNRYGFAFQRVLIVAQVAISLVLVMASFLFVGSFRKLVNLDPGFRQTGLSFLTLDFRTLGMNTDQWAPFKQQVLTRVRSVPGVESAATTNTIPLSRTGWSLIVRTPKTEISSQFTWVSPQYFATMEIPRLSGRDFNELDTQNSPKVLLVNETFVRMFLEPGNPIGKTVRSLPEPNYPDTQYEIVGVVKDSKYADLRQALRPIAYAPETQQPHGGPGMRMVLRSALPESSITTAVGQALAEVNPNVRLNATIGFRASVLDGLARDRMLAWLAGSFGVLAILLAAIGLYGAISYMTSGRRSEIGVRLALGATRGNVVSMIFRQVAILLTCGLALGAIVSLIFSGAVRSLIFDLEPADPAVLLSAVGILLLISAAAGSIPAIRAALLSPTIAMRQE